MKRNSSDPDNLAAERPIDEPIQVFVSYSHKDEALRDALNTHLSALKRQRVINAWDDRRLLPGAEWAAEIDDRVEQARVILLLISPDFLASDYCHEIEMTRALERHERGEAVVIPIILRPCDWKGELFGRLHVLPKDARAVTLWPNQDEAFMNVAEGIRAAIESMPFTEAPPSQPKPRILDMEGFGEELTRRAVREIKAANPYLLGDKFVGREKELHDLTEWLRADNTGMLCISDLGGTGKSALVWHWLNHKTTRQALDERGIRQYWCSFYARNFDSIQFLRDLADELGGVTIVERDPFIAQKKLQRAVLDRLRHERWLLVLDGLEREMGAFVDPERHLVDSEEQDRRNEANEVPIEEKYIRSLAFADFLRSLAGTGNRVLITTRIFPENLRAGDQPMPGVLEYPFHPMLSEDAERVWNLSGDTDGSPLQRQFFDSVRNHPQVISVVAAAVREQSLSFTDWFNDFEESERQACLETASVTGRRHRWLDFALRDLMSDRRDAWLTICYIVRRSEASGVTTLLKSLIDHDETEQPRPGRFRSEGMLVEVLNYLARRRLIGVDYSRGLVDVHPVIRGQVIQHILKQYEAGGRPDLELVRHLQSGQDSRDLMMRFLNQSNLEERFQSLSNVLDEFDDIPAGQQAALGILAKFYPEGAADGRPWRQSLPALRLRKDQAWVLRRTANELMTRGRWEESSAAIRRAEIAYRLCGDLQSVEDCRHSHDWQALYGGTLLQAEMHQLEILEKAGPRYKESAPFWLALLLSIRQSEHAAELLESLPKETDRWTLQTVAESWFYLEKYETAAALARQAWDLREKAHSSMAQALWEAVTLGLARVRLGKGAEAEPYLDFANRHGTGWCYNLVPMFALAGRIEFHLREAQNMARIREKQRQLANADLIYKQYCKSDPDDRFQIPASEAHLAMAMVELERDNREEARTLARRALKVALGETPPFHYGSVVRRAEEFLSTKFHEPPGRQKEPGRDALRHEIRLRDWMQKRREGV
ncbi:MAG: TIR domain-containing protein [Blastocatellia bacterium]